MLSNRLATSSSSSSSQMLEVVLLNFVNRSAELRLNVSRPGDKTLPCELFMACFDSESNALDLPALDPPNPPVEVRVTEVVGVPRMDGKPVMDGARKRRVVTLGTGVSNSE
jgi:hypothetical protein